ncbi:hypothetical protein AWB67_07284 [Caballeronia terrestris]|uniref:Uncharacterized protein n=1 Tax=Caballeronia terrestris TaxID=1226301 RepID=A0A158L0P8_9BURK|nr:hypothetical protein AWB67_07284 [Caballeronia terrestris]
MTNHARDGQVREPLSHLSCDSRIALVVEGNKLELHRPSVNLRVALVCVLKREACGVLHLFSVSRGRPCQGRRKTNLHNGRARGFRAWNRYGKQRG